MKNNKGISKLNLREDTVENKNIKLQQGRYYTNQNLDSK